MLEGIGRRALQALFDDDLPVIISTVLLAAVIFVFINLIVDIGYSFIDPRVRLS